MPLVITEGATVKCAHQGTIVPKASQSKLTIGGVAVLLSGDLKGTSFPPCPNASSSTTPCSSVKSEIGIVAGKLTVSGTGVLLDKSNGTTDGSPVLTALWLASDAGQTTVQAI